MAYSLPVSSNRGFRAKFFVGSYIVPLNIATTRCHVLSGYKLPGVALSRYEPGYREVDDCWFA